MLPVAWEADDEIFNRDLETLASQLDVAASADALRAVATVSPACNERAFKDNFEFHCGRLETLGNLLASRSIKLGLAIVPRLKRVPTSSTNLCTRSTNSSPWSVLHIRASALSSMCGECILPAI